MASSRYPVAVSSAISKCTTFFPAWSLSTVLASGKHIDDQLESSKAHVVGALVEGHTTPAVADIGAASVRLRLVQKQNVSIQGMDLPLKDGGYLLGIRSSMQGRRFLPAIAGVPGKQGLDRYGGSRIGLAECIVMGRPVTDGTATVLPDDVLQKWLPTGSDVEVVVLGKLTDFYLGMNAGTWLRIRIDELAKKGETWVCQHCSQFLPTEENTRAPETGTVMLEGTGLMASGEVGPGIEDSSAAFQYWGGSGNSGVSGQVIMLAEGTKLAAESISS